MAKKIGHFTILGEEETRMNERQGEQISGQAKMGNVFKSAETGKNDAWHGLRGVGRSGKTTHANLNVQRGLHVSDDDYSK